MGVTVRTKEELQSAYDAGASTIVVKGKLAKHIQKGRKLRSVGAGTLATLGAAIAALPFTGGLSASVVAPIAVSTGLGTATILAVIFIGIVLLIAILKDYEVIVISKKKVKLKKKA